MSAREAADRMGVKVETLYAYVSRGVLHSDPGPDGRSSVFDRRAIEALAASRPPAPEQPDDVAEPVDRDPAHRADPHGARYRGHPAADLARTHTYEQVADLLWLGILPPTHHPWPRARTSGPPDTSMNLGTDLAPRGARSVPRTGGRGDWWGRCRCSSPRRGCAIRGRTVWTRTPSPASAGGWSARSWTRCPVPACRWHRGGAGGRLGSCSTVR